MEDRPSKLRRLFGSAGIPQAKIDRLLASLRAEGEDVEDLLKTSRRQLQHAHSDLGRRVIVKETLHGNKGPFEWPCVSWTLFLKHVTGSDTAFRRLFRNLWDNRPCSSDHPYGLVVYCDEITPGNVLAPDTTRKMYCWYCSVKEWGPKVLRHSAAWVPIAIIRSSVAKDLDGGVTMCFAVILRRLFLAERISTDGVCLNVGAAGGDYARFFQAFERRCRCRWPSGIVVRYRG